MVLFLKHVACLFSIFSFLVLVVVIIPSAVWVVVMMLFSSVVFLFIKTINVVFTNSTFKIRMFKWLLWSFNFYFFNQFFRVNALLVPVNNLLYAVNSKLHKGLCIIF